MEIINQNEQTLPQTERPAEQQQVQQEQGSQTVQRPPLRQVEEREDRTPYIIKRQNNQLDVGF